ncbi:MAG: MBL fold metallo-hydrolase [Phycisphaerales bacterium]|nr:MBL fold metallo-hydrolase [Phycisphaerales bacterium]
MKVIVTGTGDAFSNRRFGSSALIQTSEGFVAIDCPPACLAMYRQASETSGIQINPGSIHDLLITHLHVDHAGGLETLGFYRRYKAPGNGLAGLWAAPAVMDRMWERLAPSMDGRMFSDKPKTSLEDFFKPGLLDLECRTKVANLEVRVRWTAHAVPTVGMLISDGTATLGWSGDTEFLEEHAQWLSEADLIVHECGESAKHATWAELSTLPLELQNRMHLLHVPDEVTLPEGPMVCLNDGDVLDITSPVTDSA